MLTREDMMKKLEDNMEWEPPMEATDQEWDLYEEVRREVARKKGLPVDEDNDIDFDNDLEPDEEIN